MKRASMICAWVLLSGGVAFAQPMGPGPGSPAPATPLAPGQPLAPVNPLYSPQSPGSNVKRNADTKAKPKPKPQPSSTDCRNEAERLRKEYYDWDAKAAKADGQEYQTAQENKDRIRRELSDLAQRCGGWAALGGPLPASGKSAGAAGGGQSGSGGASGGGSSGGGSGGGKTITPPVPKPIGGRTTVLMVAEPLGGAPARPVPKGLPTMLIRDKIARQHLEQAWQRLPAAGNIQPRGDADVEASAVAESTPPVAGASDIARNGLASIDQLELEVAALNAYALTLARFLGAQQNGDQAAMGRQAQLMLHFIDKALAAASEAARSRSLADQLILNELEQRQLSVKKTGGWSKELPKLGKISVSDLPSSVRDELKSSGLEEGIPQLQQELNALRPAAIDSAITALRTQVKADSGKRHAPQPPDLANLERERLKARELASSAGVASKRK